MKYAFTPKSSNAKTGPIPVTVSARQTCPPSCPLYKNGCYGENFHTRLHWDKVTRGERGDTWDALLTRIRALPDGQLWRHNVTGDLPGRGDDVDASKLQQLTIANRGRLGFTYTHKPLTAHNAAAIATANAGGFTVNISTQTIAEADAAVARNIGPVVTLLTEDQPERQDSPDGNPVVACPAQTRDNVTCATCGLCQKQRHHGIRGRVIIGFYVHGSSKGKAARVAAGG